MTVTDLNFADDLALISDSIEKAQALLHDLEAAAADIGLHVNDIKTDFMLVNIDDPEPTMTTLGGKPLKQVQDFKYLGSYIADSKKDWHGQPAIQSSKRSGTRRFRLPLNGSSLKPVLSQSSSMVLRPGP